MNLIIWTPLCLMGLMLSIWALQRSKISITGNIQFLGKTSFKLDCVLNWTFLAVSVLSGTSFIPSLYPSCSRSINRTWPCSIVCILHMEENWHSTGLSAWQYQSWPVISQLWLSCPGHSLWGGQRSSKGAAGQVTRNAVREWRNAQSHFGPLRFPNRLRIPRDIFVFVSWCIELKWRSQLVSLWILKPLKCDSFFPNNKWRNGQSLEWDPAREVFLTKSFYCWYTHC